MLTRYALAMVFLRKRPLAHYNPKKFPLRGPKDALRAARGRRGALRARAPLRGNSAACASRAARQMHMPTHIMKAGFCVASSLSGLHTAEWARVHYLLLCFA